MSGGLTEASSSHSGDNMDYTIEIIDGRKKVSYPVDKVTYDFISRVLTDARQRTYEHKE